MVLRCMLILDSFLVYHVSDRGGLGTEVWIAATEYVKSRFPE